MTPAPRGGFFVVIKLGSHSGVFLSGLSLLLLSSPKVSRRGAFGNQLFSVSVSFPNIIVFLSSFPSVVVGNLFLSLLFSYNFLG